MLELHGWLSGVEVGEFVRVAGTAPLPLRVDLANLVDVDRPGVAALCAQRERGVHLANASPYIGLLLKNEDETGAERPPARGGRR